MDGRSGISLEGKVGITLALVGLAGAGAMNVWPDQLWIGKSLIAISLIGLFFLGAHHVWGCILWRRIATLALLGIGLSLEYWYYDANIRTAALVPILSTPPSNSARPQPEVALPKFVDGPLQSRWEKLQFACYVPLPAGYNDEQTQKELEQFKKNIAIWGDVVDLDISVSDIRGGIKIDIEGKTPLKKQQLKTFGGLGLEKLSIEARRIDKWITVSYVLDINEGLRLWLMFVQPDQFSDDMLELNRKTARVLAVPEERCEMF